MADYSEEVKWRRANYLLRRFDNNPSTYGFDLRELLDVANYNDIPSFKVPDEVEGKVSLMREAYWPLAQLLTHPLDTRYFITCCYLGKPIADKLMYLTFLSYVNTNINNDLKITNTDLEVNADFINKVNAICAQNSIYNVDKEYSSHTNKYILQLCRNNNLKEIEPLWLLRNKAI